jgi:alpha-D-ribose 1-methylphosphonate 5-triphosphate synthase subunit PhnI
MAYVAVKGGEAAIQNSHKTLAAKRRGDAKVPELSIAQIKEQMPLAVDRVMAEGSLYDPQLAALAIKQAMGDLVEAAFLLRAYRTTLPRFGSSQPVDTTKLWLERRISSTFKDIPGGQILGSTFDYVHRLLEFELAIEGEEIPQPPESETPADNQAPKVMQLLERDGLVVNERPGDDRAPVGDLTREPLEFPAPRDMRLQNLARGDEGFLLAMAYSTQRGFGSNHPFVAECRVGQAPVELEIDELGLSVEIGRIQVTELEITTSFIGSKTEKPKFTRGYGLVFGHNERKALSMAILDRAMQTREYNQKVEAPAQDAEFVLYHSDNVESSGFVQHIKLPHYVDFQGDLEMMRKMRDEIDSLKGAEGGKQHEG